MGALIQMACARAGQGSSTPAEREASPPSGAGAAPDHAGSTGGEAAAASPAAEGSRNVEEANCGGLRPCELPADCEAGEFCIFIPSCGDSLIFCARRERACAVGCGEGVPCVIGKSKPPIVLCGQPEMQ